MASLASSHMPLKICPRVQIYFNNVFLDWIGLLGVSTLEHHFLGALILFCNVRLISRRQVGW
jgi:hypothetical protein